MYPRAKFRRGFSYLVVVAICMSVAMALAAVVTLYSYGIVGSYLIPQFSKIEFMGSAIATRVSSNSVELCFYVKNIGYKDVFISSIAINDKYTLVVDKAKVLSGLGNATLRGGTLTIPAGALVEVCGKLTTNLRSGQIVKISLEDVVGNTYYTFKKVLVYELGSVGTGKSTLLNIGSSPPSSNSGVPTYSKTPQRSNSSSPASSVPTNSSRIPQETLPDTGLTIDSKPFRVIGSGASVIAKGISGLTITDSLYYTSPPPPPGHVKGIVVGYGPENYEWWWVNVVEDGNKVEFKNLTVSWFDADVGSSCNVKAWSVYPAPHGLGKDFDSLILVTRFCKLGASKLLEIRIYKLRTASPHKGGVISEFLVYDLNQKYICRNCDKVIKAWLTPISVAPPGPHEYDYYVVSINLGSSDGKPLDWVLIAFRKVEPHPPKKGDYEVIWIKRKGAFSKIVGTECNEVSTFRWEDNLILVCKYVNKAGFTHYAFFELDKETGNVPKDARVVTTEQLASKVSFNGFLIKYLNKDPRTKDYRETYALYTLGSMRLYILKPDELMGPHPPGKVDVNKVFYSRASHPLPPPPPPASTIPVVKPLSNARCLGYATEDMVTIACYAKVRNRNNSMYGVFLMNLGYNGEAKLYEHTSPSPPNHGHKCGHKHKCCHHHCHCVCSDFASEGPYYFLGWLRSNGKPSLTVFPIIKSHDREDIVLVAMNGSDLTATYLSVEAMDHPLPPDYKEQYEFSLALSASTTSVKVGEEVRLKIENSGELSNAYLLWSLGDSEVATMSEGVYELTHTYTLSGCLDASVLALKSFLVGAPAYSNYTDIVISK